MTPHERAELTREMNRLADGDRTAFEPIFSTTWPVVHKFASRLMGPSQEADDIAQQALMKVFSRASEFEADGDALSWILGITAFEFKTAKKKTTRRKENGDEMLEEFASQAANAEEEILQRQLEETIHQAFEDLSETEKGTILIAVHDLDRPNISGAAFRKRLERALKKLRNAWSDRYE